MTLLDQKIIVTVYTTQRDLNMYNLREKRLKKVRCKVLTTLKHAKPKTWAN